MIENSATVVVSPRQLSSDLAGASVILNLNSSVYYGLDAVGARIWNLIQEPHTVREILDTLLAEYAVEPGRAERDLHSLLSKLSEAGLIEIKNAER